MMRTEGILSKRLKKYISDAPKISKERQEAWLELCKEIQKKHAVLDDKGEPKVIPNAYPYAFEMKDKEACEAEILVEKEKDQELAAALDYEENIKKKEPLEVYGVEYEDIPDAVTFKQMGVIKELVLNGPELD